MDAPAPMRTPKQQQRLNEIVSVAASVFHRKGYDAATLDEVADALGVRKASLYRYIDGKEDLLYAVIETALDRLTATSDERSSKQDAVLDRIRLFLEGHTTVLLDNLDHVSVYFADMRSLPPGKREPLERLADDYRHRLERLVLEARRVGELDPATNPELATHGLFGIVNYAHRWYRPGRGMSRKRVVEGLSRFAVSSLRSPAAGAS